LEDEARAWDQGVLEDFKRQRDTLVSVRDMFDRRDKYAKDNIPALEKRIASNETKLQNIRNKFAEQIKPGEAKKVEDAIVKVSPTCRISRDRKQTANSENNRTKNPLFNSTPAGSSSRNAFAMN
jgi:hypothetical protein